MTTLCTSAGTTNSSRYRSGYEPTPRSSLASPGPTPTNLALWQRLWTISSRGNAPMISRSNWTLKTSSPLMTAMSMTSTSKSRQSGDPGPGLTVLRLEGFHRGVESREHRTDGHTRRDYIVLVRIRRAVRKPQAHRVLCRYIVYPHLEGRRRPICAVEPLRNVRPDEK